MKVKDLIEELKYYDKEYDVNVTVMKQGKTELVVTDKIVTYGNADTKIVTIAIKH